MNCPHCKNDLPGLKLVCPQCGFDLNKTPWVVIKTVYPPDDIIIASLLASCGIPVRFVREAIGPVQGLAIGPLAEVKIAVPENIAVEAVELLEKEDTSYINDDGPE